MMKIKATFSVLAVNHQGVLLRVAGLFSRRGFNIDSLIASRTENPDYSRLTIVVTGDESVFAQVTRQLLKLEHILKVKTTNDRDFVISEMLLIKFNFTTENKNIVLNVIQSFGARILDISDKSITAELTGTADLLDRFVAKTEEFGLLELARTGVSALERGDDILANDDTL